MGDEKSKKLEKRVKTTRSESARKALEKHREMIAKKLGTAHGKEVHEKGRMGEAKAKMDRREKKLKAERKVKLDQVEKWAKEKNIKERKAKSLHNETHHKVERAVKSQASVESRMKAAGSEKAKKRLEKKLKEKRKKE